MAPWKKQYFWFSLTALFAVVSAFLLWAQPPMSFNSTQTQSTFPQQYVYRSRARLPEIEHTTVKEKPTSNRSTRPNSNRVIVDSPKSNKRNQVKQVSSNDTEQTTQQAVLESHENPAVQTTSLPQGDQAPPVTSTIEQVVYAPEEHAGQGVQLLGTIEPIQEEASHTILIRPQRVRK